MIVMHPVKLLQSLNASDIGDKELSYGGMLRYGKITIGIMPCWIAVSNYSFVFILKDHPVEVLTKCEIIEPDYQTLSRSCVGRYLYDSFLTTWLARDAALICHRILTW